MVIIISPIEDAYRRVRLNRRHSRHGKQVTYNKAKRKGRRQAAAGAPGVYGKGRSKGRSKGSRKSFKKGFVSGFKKGYKKGAKHGREAGFGVGYQFYPVYNNNKNSKKKVR